MLLEPISRVGHRSPLSSRATCSATSMPRGRVRAPTSTRRPPRSSCPGSPGRAVPLRRRSSVIHRRPGSLPEAHDHYDVVPSHLTSAVAASAAGSGAARPTSPDRSARPQRRHTAGPATEPSLAAYRRPFSRPTTAGRLSRPRGMQAFPTAARVSGKTRASATAVMKLVSPTQRGTACRCRCRGMPAPAARPRLAPMFTPSGA